MLWPRACLALTSHCPFTCWHQWQQQEKRIEDAIKSIREQYEGVLEKKQEEYVEKYRHLQYIEVGRRASKQASKGAAG